MALCRNYECNCRLLLLLFVLLCLHALIVSVPKAWTAEALRAATKRECPRAARQALVLLNETKTIGEFCRRGGEGGTGDHAETSTNVSTGTCANARYATEAHTPHREVGALRCSARSGTWTCLIYFAFLSGIAFCLVDLSKHLNVKTCSNSSSCMSHSRRVFGDGIALWSETFAPSRRPSSQLSCFFTPE